MIWIVASLSADLGCSNHAHGMVCISIAYRQLILEQDGARIFETAAATGLTLKQLCDPFDSVSLCLSKGIGAPIGRYVRILMCLENANQNSVSWSAQKNSSTRRFASGKSLEEVSAKVV